jgi:hypothetical protein
VGTTTSSIPAVTDALLALLDQQPWPTPKPQIADGWWRPDEQDRECVVVGDTNGGGTSNQRWAALGTRSRDEQYPIALTVEVRTRGLSPKEARDRAFALFAVAEVALRSSTRFGLDAGGLDPEVRVTNAELLEPRHRLEQTTEGTECVITSGLQVTTRI